MNRFRQMADMALSKSALSCGLKLTSALGHAAHDVSPHSSAAIKTILGNVRYKRCRIRNEFIALLSRRLHALRRGSIAQSPSFRLRAQCFLDFLKMFTTVERTL